jgi:hypothetical protein
MNLTNLNLLFSKIMLTGGFMKTVFVTLTVLLTLSVQAADIPRAVYNAHAAYLKGDGRALIKEMKEALVQTQNSPAVVKNMTSLYNAALKNSLVKSVEPDWRLPKEVTYVGFEVQRRLKQPQGNIGYVMAVFTGVKDSATLEQLQVIRYPNTVIFDRAAKIGYWWEGHSAADNANEFWAGSPAQTKPVEEGLYLLNIKLKDQPLLQGWFILSNKNASTSPVVLAPQVNQVYNNGLPQFSWSPFQSPEFLPSERSRVHLKVTKANSEEDDVAEASLSDRKATTYKFGDKSVTDEFEGPAELPSGHYYFRLLYRETEEFGPMLIRRTSVTKVPFSVN